MLGSWLMDGRYGFLLRRLSRCGVSDLEFDSVFGVLPRSDSFNGNGFTFGEPPWRSAKLHISDGAASSSGEEVIHHFFSSVTAAVVPEAGDGRWCQAQRCSAIFSVLSCRFLRDLYFVLYDMNETRITMQKKIRTKGICMILPPFPYTRSLSKIHFASIQDGQQ